jgi:hypothetical protein
METGEHQENWMITILFTNRIKQKRIKRLGQDLKTSIGSKDKYRIKRHDIILKQGKEQEKKEGSRDKKEPSYREGS